MTVMESAAITARQIPTIRSADWFIRIPLAAIIIEQGFFKLPDFAGQAESFGLPIVLFALATFAEIAGGIAILLGGLLRNN